MFKKFRKEFCFGFYFFLVFFIFEREGELYGYVIWKRFEELSGGKFVFSEGVLYDFLKSFKKFGFF